MDSNECPMCDADTITTWRVVATAEIIQVCGECDSVWEEADELPGPAATTVEQFLSLRGRPALWSELQATA